MRGRPIGPPLGNLLNSIKLLVVGRNGLHRMGDIKLWYDREGDYLEVLFEDSPASMEEIAEDVLERRTTDGRVVGFSIFNFSKHDRDSLTVPLSITATPNR
jgi:uncharacterized protein YuzE